MKYTFSKYLNISNDIEYSNINKNNELYIFDDEGINIFDIKKKEPVSKILFDTSNLVRINTVNSNGNLFLSWNSSENLNFYDLTDKNNINLYNYIPEVEVKHIYCGYKIEFINDDKYFVYNCENYIEIIDIKFLKPVLRIKDKYYPDKSDNLPIFNYDKKNNFLITSFHYSNYDSMYFPEDFSYCGSSCIKIFDLSKLEVKSEAYFNGQFIDLIYSIKFDKIICLTYPVFYDAYIKNITILEFDKNSILKVKDIEIEDKITLTKTIIENPITNDIFLLYIDDKKELNIFTINLDTYQLELILKEKTEIDYLSKIIFSPDGKYFIIGDNKIIEIFEIICN
ncbi:MAG: hypothetical protein AABZ74_18770 [Cyanobacteriota bacterium]